MIDYILKNNIHIPMIFEFLAMCAGLIYYFRFKGNIEKGLKIFIFYLVFIFFIECIALYALWAYLDNYETFPFLKDSGFTRNFWLYNIANVIKYVCIGFLFTSQIDELGKYQVKKILNGLLVGLVIYSVICFSTFGSFFDTYDPSVMIIGTLVILSCIMSYFFEILLSDKILNFRSDALFYFAVVILMWHLLITPLDFYMSFTGLESMEFRQLYINFLRVMNILMYSTFAFGFYIDYRKRKKQEFISV